MYLKDYDIIKVNKEFRLVRQSDPDNRLDPIDEGLFEPGDTFTVGPSGWLEFVGNKVKNFYNDEKYKNNNI